MTGVEQQLLSNQLLQQLVTPAERRCFRGQSDRRDCHRARRHQHATRTSAASSPRSPRCGGQTMLTVGNQQVPLNSITGVTDAPRTPPPHTRPTI